MRVHRVLLTAVLLLGTVIAPSLAAAQGAPPPRLPGQSVTLMPDGRWLLVGGQGPSGPVNTASFFDPRNGLTTPAPWRLTQARAGHSATLLPDGGILVVGGVGTGNQVVAIAELFDPPTQAFYPLPQSGLTPRTGHTATLLTDGRVLIAGGASASGQVLAQAELWDSQAQTTQPAPASASTARQGATATLLPDGTVLLWGGTGPGGAPLATGEVYDPVQQRFTPVTTLPPGAQPLPVAPQLAASLPTVGSADVPLDALLVLRFSKPLEVGTLNAVTVTLSGPAGPVPAVVMPAEGGRLAFVTPQGALAPATAYTLSVNGATDSGGLLLPFTSVNFITAPLTAQAPSTPAGPPSPHAHQPLIAQPATPPPGAPAQLDAWEWTGARKNGKPYTTWMDLAPLQAPAGATALAGQVLQLNGQPLANVTLQLGGRLATSDATGRFLLAGIPDGYQPLLMIGGTANSPGKTYGTFEYGVGIDPKQTNLLPFTIWMPLLDTQNAIRLPAGPTSRKIMGTTPTIPGLEVHIPAGVTLRAPSGEALQALSLTPVPLDRTPFPLPAETLYFVAPQGHGTQVQTHDGAMALAGAGVRVVFPNAANHPPGTRLRFRSYDVHGFGWYELGTLTVSADGKQIASAPRVTVGEIGCIWIINGGADPRTPLGDLLAVAEPVNASTGLFMLDKTDLVVPDVLPIVLRRNYRSDGSMPANLGSFGLGTEHDYQMELLGDGQAYQWANVVLGDGRNIHYTRTSPGTGYADAVMEHTATPTRFYKSQLYWSAAIGAWELKLTDGTRYQYQLFAGSPKVKAIVDRVGNQLTITRPYTGEITRITTPNGRWVEFTYSVWIWPKITQARDNAGRTVSYEYNANLTLWRVTDVGGGVTEYTYAPYPNDSRILTIKDARGIVFLTNEYDANGRIFRQTQADNTTWQLAYTVDGNGKVTQTDVTNPRGFIERIAFNADGWATSITHALGQPEQQTTSYVRQAGTNLVTSMTDALSRRIDYTFNVQGRVLTVTRLAGTPQAVTTTYTYEPAFNKVATTTDSLNHTTTFGYDGVGNRTTITDPRGKVTTLTYDSQKRPLTIKDPLNHTWTYTYDGPDLATVKNPLNQTTTRYSDAVGRLVSLKDPLGNQSRYAWDALNRLNQITDALSGATQFGYDPNGNLLSVADARGNQTQYTPDAMDRVQTQSDALLHPESYTYDSDGNLLTFTDRKGQQRNYSYDALGRMTRVDHADGSFTTYTWDAGNRLTQVTDSLTGTITRTPDSLNRLQQEVTSQGTVSYAYDNASRRTSMTVAGQPQVTYGYDNANRLTSITQGTASVTIGYDDANRRTSLTLPNTVQATYGYDTSNRLTSITFKKGAVTLGTLTYTYDAAGRRTALTGTWARTGLPAAVASASYNANNQQTAWGGQTITFDLNGNLISDGANTYTWDARDRLVGISGGTTASFTYDPTGRRASKTIAGTTTQFLYDGPNPVQELSGTGTVLANLLTGLGIDEYFTRTDGSGRSTLLADALGSIFALTDDAGAVQTQYTYEPFGNTTASGQASGSSFQYTGRENDGAGLYYYRARYFGTGPQRFLSEDPLRSGGGDFNLYAYVLNSPTNRIDPKGLSGSPCGAVSQLVPTAEASPLAGRYNSSGSSMGPDLCTSGFIIWGHYCGGFGTRGDDCSDEAPADDLDWLCYDHDNCYGRCGATAADNFPGPRPGSDTVRGRCMDNCDFHFCAGLTAIWPGWDLKKRAAKFAMWSSFRCSRFFGDLWEGPRGAGP
jgi:RHS repeat-associated protein